MRFDEAFRSLTDFAPMRWQEALFQRFFTNDVPAICDIPTGLGKTSVLVVWFLALTCQAETGTVRLPRRLVYIVNRRTVVDQATDVAEQIRRRVHNPVDAEWSAHRRTLEEIAGTLRGLCSTTDEPLGVSTLRGELADNEEWKADPTRAAIIVGTVDMIGSKLLFSGYGDGRYNRAHHAGLIGQDTLIVHDEAHLTPAFSRLLWTVEREQRLEEAAQSGVARPIVVMELSATARRDEETRSVRQAVMGLRGQTGTALFEDFPSLSARESLFSDPVVRQRLRAVKRLSVKASIRDAGDVVRSVAETALGYEGKGCRVLIYLRRPEEAKEVAHTLRRELDGGAGRVALLTGTMRGYERDRLIEGGLFKAFRSDSGRPPALERTLYLVSTSAGEVGVDLDADHLVCDLTTLDSMAQRFGRVNRLGVDAKGTPRESSITVAEGLIDDGDPLKTAIERTSQLIRRLPRTDAGYDASPVALATLLTSAEAAAAFSPRGTVAPLTDILVDSWSLTSIDEIPGRPEVAGYLHGLTAEPPETHVVWRAEILVLDRLAPPASRSGDNSTGRSVAVRELIVRDWFAACRIEAQERLRDQSQRVLVKLRALLATHRRGDPNRDFPVALLDERGGVEWSTLAAVAAGPEAGHLSRVAYRTIVLPVEAGGLDEHGMLDGRAVEPVAPVDVAETGPSSRERWLHVRASGGDRYVRLRTGETTVRLPPGLRECERIVVTDPPEGEEEGAALELVLLTAPADAVVGNPEATRLLQRLTDHTRRVIEYADRIAKALGVSDDVRSALTNAAKYHDRGKDRRRWQFYAYNEDGPEPLAKARRYRDPRRTLLGYRHEFGSLLEALAAQELCEHAERELVLHLICAHHGWARPHFESTAYDHEGPPEWASGRRGAPTTAENGRAATETLQRFGRVQRRFGRWGLVWLESLLRCADIAASRNATEATAETELADTALGSFGQASDQPWGTAAPERGWAPDS